jgi:hypothetical protein
MYILSALVRAVRGFLNSALLRSFASQNPAAGKIGCMLALVKSMEKV